MDTGNIPQDYRPRLAPRTLLGLACHTAAGNGGRDEAFGISATGMSVALTVVKPGGFMNRLLIVGRLVMFTLPL